GHGGAPAHVDAKRAQAERPAMEALAGVAHEHQAIRAVPRQSREQADLLRPEVLYLVHDHRVEGARHAPRLEDLPRPQAQFWPIHHDRGLALTGRAHALEHVPHLLALADAERASTAGAARRAVPFPRSDAVGLDDALPLGAQR